MLVTRSDRTPAAAAGAPFAEVIAKLVPGILGIRRVEVCLATAVASDIGLIKSTTQGTEGAGDLVPVPFNVNIAGAPIGRLRTSWTVVPTIAATPLWLRRADLPATVGERLVWTFDDEPLMIDDTSSLLIWNFGAGLAGALDVSVDWFDPAS